MAWIWSKKTGAGNKPRAYLSLDAFPKIQGYNFADDFNARDFLKQYKNMGFQGSNLGIAMEILNEMLKNKIPIYLSFTGNMISSGNRELITYLVKNNLIKGIVTTASSVEEDIIKCIRPFYLGAFDIKGSYLLENTIGRIGNIFVPANHYLYLERFLNEMLPILYARQKETRNIISSHELSKELGMHIEKNENTKDNHKESFLYWASKNNIPVFVPGITDGTLGDILVFFKRNNKGFAIDSTSDNSRLTQLLMDEEKAGCVILGGGISKHFLLNAAIFRDGFDYSIYLTTSQEFDGSDSGGNQEEAISWAKIKPNARRIKVIADATITFPLLIASMKK